MPRKGFDEHAILYKEVTCAFVCEIGVKRVRDDVRFVHQLPHESLREDEEAKEEAKKEEAAGCQISNPLNGIRKNEFLMHTLNLWCLVTRATTGAAAGAKRR